MVETLSELADGFVESPVMLQLGGLLLLVLLLLVIAVRLQAVRELLLPEAAQKAEASDLPRMMLRKAYLMVYGAYFLILSKDKVGKKDLKRASEQYAAAAAGQKQKTVRIIFVRHGESVWNYVFNRGFGPSFLVRLVEVTLHELYLLPWDDSAYIDSPLSTLGLDQCAGLLKFLRKPCVDPRAQKDFAALTQGDSDALLVSSQLRRAVATVLVALSDRLRRTKERVVLNSSCQEISRNFDTMALAPKRGGPRMGSDVAFDLDAAKAFDASANHGNKSLGTPGYARLRDFAQWAADRPESTIIVGGHSLWFRSFFQVFMPPTSTHVCKKNKIVNCGVVAFDLHVTRTAGQKQHGFFADPESLVVVYGGFASK